MTHRIPENSVKAAQGLEPTLQTNGGNILLGGAQKLAGPFDAIEVYKLSEVHGKQAVEQPGEIMVLEAQKIKPLSGNVTPNYGRLLAEGFDGCTERIKAAMAKTDDPEKLKFGRDMLDTIEISMTLVDDYRAAAKEQGSARLCEALCRVPRSCAVCCCKAPGWATMMINIKKATQCPATADGRLAYTPYPCSFLPSIGVKTEGLLSVIQSFTKHDFTNIINGGPLTVELHDTVLRNDVGISKVAQLVKRYIELGGHQLQLNAVNGETLQDAKRHPEKYPNLIVRVWGWSGYFVELDQEYQDHILSRTQYT